LYDIKESVFTIGYHGKSMQEGVASVYNDTGSSEADIDQWFSSGKRDGSTHTIPTLCYGGSPIFNVQGKVIGLHSHPNPFGRITIISTPPEEKMCMVKKILSGMGV
jgi:hypothetical protein